MRMAEFPMTRRTKGWFGSVVRRWGRIWMHQFDKGIEIVREFWGLCGLSLTR